MANVAVRPRRTCSARLALILVLRTQYTGGDQVVYNGELWTAKWWSYGDTPGGESFPAVSVLTHGALTPVQYRRRWRLDR